MITPKAAGEGKRWVYATDVPEVRGLIILDEIKQGRRGEGG